MEEWDSLLKLGGQAILFPKLLFVFSYSGFFRKVSFPINEFLAFAFGARNSYALPFQIVRENKSLSCFLYDQDF